jgi:hypothetical protein
LTWVSFGADALILQNVLTQAAIEHRVIYFLGFFVMTLCTYIFFSGVRYDRWLAFIIAAGVPLYELLLGLKASAIVMAAVASFSFTFCSMEDSASGCFLPMALCLLSRHRHWLWMKRQRMLQHFDAVRPHYR